MKIIETLIQNDPVALNLISSSAIYSALEEGEREEFIQKAYIALFEPGEFLIREDEIGDRFFIIKSGEVEIFTEKSGKRVSLAILSIGACIGEGSLITNSRRTASAECLTEVTAIVFNFSDISKIIDNNPKVKKLLIKLIEKRAECTIERLLNYVD